MGEVIRNIERAPTKDIMALKSFSTGMLSDAMGKTGQMGSSIKPVYKGAKIAGPAITVLCPVADNLTIHKAMEIAQAGDVLVVNAGGYPNCGLFGDIMALAAKTKGLTGVVIDGGVRDSASVSRMPFPVFSSAINPGGTVKETLGTINRPVQCGGVPVNPGDIVIGDDDGVVIIPKEKAAEVIQKATRASKLEEDYRKELMTGKSTMQILGFDKILKAKGLE